MRALFGFTWKSAMPWRSPWNYHASLAKKKKQVLPSMTLISDSTLQMTCRMKQLSKQPLLGRVWTFIMKIYFRVWKRFLFLMRNYKLNHEPVFTLTHIFNTLTMRRGSWQQSRAEGLGSFAGGKEFGPSTCARFQTHVIIEEKTAESFKERHKKLATVTKYISKLSETKSKSHCESCVCAVLGSIVRKK